MDKQQAIFQILSFGPQRDEAFSVYLNAESQPDDAPFLVTKTLLISVLHQYLAQTIDDDDLEQWANLINFRDDINGEAIEDWLYALANQEMMGNGNKKANIERMLALLSDSE
ncbi:hypothetical protein [Photobacterium leiognathi]|uniref:Orphan protein n=1 Tax=Photobacterium leiognathi TaxID=553611 RepID=A0ABX5GEJ6_PHOLE|nr:hypothetical protein [Photobacterium leiognathi]KJF87513.1 hypothetical protein UB42_17410 [Photobacterium leiognathi]PSV80924.1 hypothetical protein CTM94_12735 [Photobacterium leiognathi]